VFATQELDFARAMGGVLGGILLEEYETTRREVDQAHRANFRLLKFKVIDRKKYEEIRHSLSTIVTLAGEGEWSEAKWEALEALEIPFSSVRHEVRHEDE